MTHDLRSELTLHSAVNERGVMVGRSDASSRDREGMADPRHRFPARPGRPQFEWEAPRLVKTESRVGEPVDGLSRRMARRRVAGLKALGNAVVPAIPELIGRALLTPEVTPHV